MRSEPRPLAAAVLLGTHRYRAHLALNTRRSYRDAFTLLLPFIASKARKPVDRLTVRDLTAKRVLQFLADLEERRACSIQTRNQRLAAIRAFARFVSSRDPGHVDWYAQIRAITTKKSTPQPVSWMTRTEMEAVLEAANRKTLRGRTEYALLLFLYNTGARVSEATQLVVGNLQVGRRNGRHALVTIHGKGGKIRQCPLWPHTERALAELVQGRTDNASVFLSQHRAPYTRFGVYRLVRRCAARVPWPVRKSDYAPRRPAHQCMSPSSGWRRPEYHPCMARPRQSRYDQHLCRNRPRDEGQSDGALRDCGTRTATTMEERPGANELSENALSAECHANIM